MHISSAAPNSFPSQLSVGHLNLWNFFDPVDNPYTNDTVVSPEEYSTRLQKLALVITTVLKSPNIISFNEIESRRVLNDLLNLPAVKELGYKGIIRSSNDARGITTAVLYRGPLTPVKIKSINTKESFNTDPAKGQKDQSLLYSRPPLVIDFQVTGMSQAVESVMNLSVIVNHFKSKLGGVGPEQRRQRQGEFLGEYVDKIRSKDPNKRVLVIGDLNATYEDGAYKKLAFKKDGSIRMVDALQSIELSDRYTYIYRGQKNLLDHLMVAGDLKLSSIAIPHIDTIKGAEKYRLDSTVPWGISDHDPILAVFQLS